MYETKSKGCAERRLPRERGRGGGVVLAPAAQESEDNVVSYNPFAKRQLLVRRSSTQLVDLIYFFSIQTYITMYR
jgi:hypothetical protein